VSRMNDQIESRSPSLAILDSDDFCFSLLFSFLL